MVVGCFGIDGDQFSQVWPRFESAGVDIYMPEIGGRYDSSQPLSKTMMSVQGAMSEAEVAQVRRRVRETMAALVIHEGRHMGGRAPYGYVAVNSEEPHPNPKFAAEGRFKRILVVDPEAADVVQRIFNLYISGIGQRAIAKTLNAESIPCPSAHRPEQNKHRLQDGWQTSTIEAILRNDKYTGYYLWGAFERSRPLLDPENPSLGWELRHRRAADEKRVRSRSQAHEPIVPMHIFREAQTVRARRGSKMKRDERVRIGPPKYVAIFRGTIRCGICNRKMHPCRTGTLIRYQCRARDIAPGSSIAEDHPTTVNLNEKTLKAKVDLQLLRFFAPENRDRTFLDLIDSQERPLTDELQRKREQRDIADAQRDARNLVEAVAKSGGSQLLLDALAKVEKRLGELIATQTPEDDTLLLNETEVRAWIDGIDFDVAAMLATAEPQDLYEFHQAVGLHLVYNANKNTCEISIGTTTGWPPASAGNHPVNSDRVRGGTRTPTPYTGTSTSS